MRSDPIPEDRNNDTHSCVRANGAKNVKKSSVKKVETRRNAAVVTNHLSGKIKQAPECRVCTSQAVF